MTVRLPGARTGGAQRAAKKGKKQLKRLGMPRNHGRNGENKNQFVKADERRQPEPHDGHD